MKKELLGLLKKAKPAFGPIHREAVNLSWILEIHSSSLQTGFYVFQSLEQTHFLPMVDGALWGNLPEYFEMLSFYKSTKNFLIHNFQLPISPDIPLCKGEPIWVNLESLSFNIKEFFKKLEHFATTGFVEVEDRVKREKGYIFLQNGLIVDAKIKQQRGEEALKQIINSLSENVCLINLYQLEDIALSFLLSDPKVVSVSWNLEDAQDFCQELSKRHMELPLLLVSVSMQDYGYRVFMDGYVIYQASFDEKADVFEVHLVSQIKQFMGLEHPVVEMRINVIHTVGMKDLISALPQLEHMANKESNPMLLMAIVDALGRMSHPEAIELLRKLSNHTYPVIRSRARYMLDKKFTHKT